MPGGRLPVGMTVAGAAGGALTTAAALAEGHRAAVAALGELGLDAAGGGPPGASDEAAEVTPFWHVRRSRGRALAGPAERRDRKGRGAVAPRGLSLGRALKRYTTLGMATDQGKTANVMAHAIVAELAGRTIEETGTTVFRPPYTPAPIAAFAGRARGKEFRPLCLTPGHDWAERQGAVFVESGLWLRAQWFPQAGETHWRQSVDREVVRTRGSVGICDVTTLGKNRHPGDATRRNS